MFGCQEYGTSLMIPSTVSQPPTVMGLQLAHCTALHCKMLRVHLTLRVTLMGPLHSVG